MSKGERNEIASFFIALSWWAAAALLFWLLFWATAGIERRSLARSVNAAFEAAHDPRRVAAPLPTWGPDGEAALAGRRFALKQKNETAVVFSVNGAGASASYVAVFSAGKGVVSVLPLPGKAPFGAERLPAGLFETYVHRIAVSEASSARKKAESK